MTALTTAVEAQVKTVKENTDNIESLTGSLDKTVTDFAA